MYCPTCHQLHDTSQAVEQAEGQVNEVGSSSTATPAESWPQRSSQRIFTVINGRYILKERYGNAVSSANISGIFRLYERPGAAVPYLVGII
jgi:hypothetical protein